MIDLFKNIKIKKIALFLTILFVFMTFEAIYLLFGYDFNKLSEEEFYFITFSKYVVVILFFILYYSKYLKDKWLDFRKKFKKYAKISFKDWFTGFLIMYLSNMIIMRIIGTTGQNEETVQALISNVPFIAFILTTVLAPFTEEMIFRKCLQDCFNEKKISKYLFMIISGLIFGLVHVLGASNSLEYLLIIPYGALGFMFAHTLLVTDNIYNTIMVHMFHNGVLTLLSILVNL